MLLFQASNHVAAIDDPFVIASLLPPSVMLNANNLRWTLCASDRCFKNRAMSAFFRSVKVLPVSRGDGIYQKVYSPMFLLWVGVEVSMCLEAGAVIVCMCVGLGVGGLICCCWVKMLCVDANL